jgi:16S rRNA (uracil1498-N3)-methyltransferase
MYLFYSSDIASLTLSEEESSHCAQVLRAKTGDPIQVTDGQGTIYEAEIVNPHRKHCEFRIKSVETPEALHAGWIHVGIAPTKNIDRTEWAIEKCVEMGADEITLLLCDHSERKTVNYERLQKIVVSAAKQSLKTRFPKLNPLTKMTDLQVEGDKFIAHCIEGYKATDDKLALKDKVIRGNQTTILIGPEGDFSPEEVKWALENGYEPVSLGAARLRTETASIVACHTAVLTNE